MLRVPLNKIQPGMILARPIHRPADSTRYLLQRDMEIPLDLVPRLSELGVYEVWVRCRDLEFLEQLIDEELTDRQREVYTHVRRNFEAVMRGAALDLDISQFQTSISGLFDYLKGSASGSVLLQKLDAFDNYLMAHSTNVCYLSMMLGMKLERYIIAQRHHKPAREAKDLQELGLGCLLHDVGKMRIAPEILNKPGRLTVEEMEIMKLHPTLGHELVKGQIPPAAAQIVLNHHQRWDGKGYPARVAYGTGEQLPPLAGNQIPVFSRIATVADIYDAATTKRCYSAAKPPVQVLHEMRTICRGAFDAEIERVFYQIIPPFPIGQVVTLSDGMEAAVVDFNPRMPMRPKVQGLRYPSGEPVLDPSLEELDLSLYTDLAIVAVDSIDVRPFTAGLEAATALAALPG